MSSRSAPAIASLIALLGTGCATILRDSRNELVLHSAPSDLRVWSFGVEVPLQPMTPGAPSGEAKYSARISSSLRELQLKTRGMEVPVSLGRHISAGWVVADILLTGLTGVVIDAITSKWEDFDDLNVSAVVASQRSRPHEGPAAILAAAEQGSGAPNRAPILGAPLIEDRPAAVAASPPASGHAAGEPVLKSGKLAVLDFKSYASDFKPEDVRYFTDLVRGATLRVSPGVDVMTRENLLVLLQATGKDVGNCEGECEVDTGRRIGADAIISGEVLKVGSYYKMSLKLHETRGGRLLSTAIASGKTVDELDESLQKAAEALLRSRR